MLILVSELSKFNHHLYPHQNPSLNTREIELPSPPSIPKSTLHQRRPSKPSCFSDPVIPCWWLFAVKKAPQLQHLSLQLPHVIWSGMIAKHPPFVQPVILIPFSNRTFFRLRRLNLFPDFLWIFCLVMSSNGHNHCSVYRHKTHEYSSENLREMSTRLVFKFPEFSFWILVKNSK
jgi:hypothetical protein